MRKLILPAALLLVFPSTALAGPSPTAADRARAAKTCSNVKAAIGARAFSQLFAPANRSVRASERACVRRQTAFEHRNRENPQWKEECQPLLENRDTGRPEATPATSRNEYGRCVARLARQKSRGEERRTIGAAQRCKEERRADAAAFRSAYGGRPNAFAKCVAAKKAENGG